MKSNLRRSRNHLSSLCVWALLAALALSALSVSCGRSGSSMANGSSASSSASRQVRSIDLAKTLAEVGAASAPTGPSAKTFGTLRTALKRLLVARSDGKNISSTAIGTADSVPDLKAVSDSSSTFAALTWTERLRGDYNGDGVVNTDDLQPLALSYGMSVSANPEVAKLDGDGSGEIGIGDIVPIAEEYLSRIQGYRVYRGRFNGQFTEWEVSFRPNPNTAHRDWSVDRTGVSGYQWEAYTYVDYISGLGYPSQIRYVVVPYADGAEGVASNEAALQPAGSS